MASDADYQRDLRDEMDAAMHEQHYEAERERAAERRLQETEESLGPYHVSWETKDGDQYENEYRTLTEVADLVMRLGTDMITIRPPGWFDADDEDPDEDPEFDLEGVDPND